MPNKQAKVDEGAEPETVQLELEGFTPLPEDRDGIVQLLNQLFPKNSGLHLGGIADYIISLENVGTIVKNCSEVTEAAATDADDQEDDDIVFSITTVVSLTKPSIAKCSVLADLKKFLLDLASKSESAASEVNAIKALLNGEASKKCALLLNERFVNLPPSISAKAVDALPAEIQNLKEEERPTDLLILTRGLKPENAGTLVYIQPEMEIVRQAADACLETKITNASDGDDPETVIYILMAVKMSSLPGIIESLADMP
ncbi:unnamed protein product [Dibothriocephalus latus]|uniref:Protein BCCIP homolog n=1 Tax=Dibothriocephalus latus TaxID=60516 RepID=A0A3P7LMZ2_DIBLA|nr:unnamed protein product [Dibothriocephalus latus]